MFLIEQDASGILIYCKINLHIVYFPESFINSFLLPLTRKKSVKMLKDKLFLLFALIFSIFVSLSFVSASFTFQGYTKYVNGTNMTNVNVSIDIFQFQEGGPPETIATIQNISDSNAYFNITINTYDNSSYMYQPSIIKYNSTNGLAEYIGQSIPSLMYDDMMMLESSPITFYLKQAITVDLSGIGIEHGIQNNVTSSSP